MVHELQYGLVALAIAYLAEDGQRLAFRPRPQEVVHLLQRRSVALQRVKLPFESLEVCLLWLRFEFALSPAADASGTARSVAIALDHGVDWCQPGKKKEKRERRGDLGGLGGPEVGRTSLESPLFCAPGMAHRLQLAFSF